MSHLPMQLLKKLSSPLTWFRSSIKNKILISVLTVFLIAYGLSISWMYNRASSDALKAVRQETLSTAQIIAVAIYRNHEIPRDFREIQSYIMGTKRYKKTISAIHVISRQMKIISSTDYSLLMSRSTNSIYREIIRNNTSMTDINDSGNHPRIRIIYPISAGPGKRNYARGAVELTASLKAHLSYLAGIQRNILIAGFLIILAIVMAVLLISGSITRPITRLYDGIVKLEEGDFTVSVPADSSDEIGFLTASFNNMVMGLRERFQLSRFVSKSTMRHVSSGSDLQMGGVKKRLTVLFSDVRGFTSFSEKHDPEYVMEKLNELMHLQTEIIQKYSGDIDKYVGDEIMAIFEGKEMELRACRAAVEMIHGMKKRNREQKDNFYIGIGINCGEMISGNMGSKNRIDRTVIGDEVNLGARLVSAAGKNRIIISDSVFTKVRDSVRTSKHETISVKGKREKVTIHTLRGMG